MFEVEYTNEFEAWWEALTQDEQKALDARVALLIQRGPALRRPIVGEIKGSAFDPRMKELICEEGSASLRVLFIFDPRRTAILLLGGDKTGQWRAWVPGCDPRSRRPLSNPSRRATSRREMNHGRTPPVE